MQVADTLRATRWPRGGPRWAVQRDLGRTTRRFTTTRLTRGGIRTHRTHPVCASDDNRNPVLPSFKWGKAPSRKQLASLGTSVLLSYGFVSNVNACTLVTIAWITCGKTTGLSPLAAGNWKAFLGIYGGLYLSFGNLLRPLRASLAVAISPLFDKLVSFLQNKFRVKRPVAFGITVFLVNVLGSITYFALIISAACLIFKAPLLP